MCDLDTMVSKYFLASVGTSGDFDDESKGERPKQHDRGEASSGLRFATVET